MRTPIQTSQLSAPCEISAPAVERLQWIACYTSGTSVKAATAHVSASAEDRLLHLRSAVLLVSLLCRCYTSWSAVSAPAEDRLLHLRSAVSAPGVCACRGPPATPQVVGVVVMSLLHFMVGGGCARRGPPATPQVGGVAATLMVGGVGACSGSPVAPRSLGRRWSSSLFSSLVSFVWTRTLDRFKR